MMAPRVLILTETGFASPYWEGVFSCLADRGVDAIPVALREDGALPDDAGRSFRLGASSAPGYLAAAIRLSAVVRRMRADLVHAHEPLSASVAVAALCLPLRSTPVVYHRHHADTTPLQARLSAFAARFSTLTLTVSEAASAASLRTERARRLGVALNGVPEPKAVVPAASRRESLGLGAEALVVLVVARFRPEKGHHRALAAFAAFHVRAPQAHLVFVGDGPTRSGVEQAARSLGLAGQVHFVGHRTDVGSWYRAADVVLVPSDWESFGLSAAEAMACSKPVIACRVGGLPEVVLDGVTGLVVDPDPIEIAEALDGILSDPAKSRRMGLDGRARYDALFTPGAMVEAWVSWYEFALHSQGN